MSTAPALTDTQARAIAVFLLSLPTDAQPREVDPTPPTQAEKPRRKKPSRVTQTA